MGFKRGQVSIEYVFILAVVLGFVVMVMLGGLRESELTFAMGAAREATASWVAENDSVYFTALNFTQSGRSVNLSPVIYYWNGARLQQLPDPLRTSILDAVKRTTAPLAPPASGYCFSSANYDYCVNVLS